MERLSFTQVLKVKDMDSSCHLVMTKANLTHIKPQKDLAVFPVLKYSVKKKMYTLFLV